MQFSLHCGPNVLIFCTSGEKPFRCLLKTCLKRFRYKGDLSKHIKKYHPGHTQELTPVPVQEDELINMQNQTKSSTSTQQTIVIEAATASTSSTASTVASASDNKFFLPLLPRHPVQQAELVGFSKDLSTGQDNLDPSLDDNLMDLLASSEDAASTESIPMLSISPGPSLPPPPPPPPPPMPPPKTASASGATIVSSKLHEVLTQGRPKPSHSVRVSQIILLILIFFGNNVTSILFSFFNFVEFLKLFTAV